MEKSHKCDSLTRTRRPYFSATTFRLRPFHFFHFSTFLLLASVIPSGAGQLARPAIVAVDSSVAIDRTRTATGDESSAITMDAVMSMGVGGNFEAIVRPWVQKSATGEWNRQVWVAALRYERPGPVGLRVDAGLIPSPIGMSNMLLRPQLNANIS